MIDWTKVLVTTDDDIVGVAAGNVVLLVSGVAGAAATLEVVLTETLEPDQDAYVQNIGTPQNARLKFGIPRGASGVWGGIVGSLEDQTDLKDTLDEKADIIKTSASGAVVSISDGAAYPVDALNVSIEPVQDLHGYDNPWPAGGGKNLYAGWTGTEQTINDVKFTPMGDGSLKVVGTASAMTDYQLYTDNGFSVPADGTYTFSCSGASANCKLIVGGASCTSGLGYAELTSGVKTQSLSAGTTGYNIVRVASGATVNTTLYPQCEVGSSATSWAPYSNVCPISGHTQAVVTRTGKNLLPVGEAFDETVGGEIRFQSDGHGTYHISGTPTATRAYNFSIPEITLPNEDLYVHLLNDVVTGNFSFAFLNNSTQYAYIIPNVQQNKIEQKDALKGKTVNTLRLFVNGAQTIDLTIRPMILLTNTASDYVEPHVQSVTIDLDGTRYGGTVDVLTGEMTVDRAYITLDDDSTIGMDSASWNPNSPTFYISLQRKSTIGSSSIAPNILSNYCQTVSYNTVKNTSEPWKCSVTGSGSYISWSAPYNSVQDMKDYLGLNNLIFVYELATPLTVQLDPHTLSLLLGDNNIWADTGSTSVGYKADTKLFIERLTQPSEDDMTANVNIASGKFFMVGNNLYYSTASIASGEQIVPGTNCTALSLADALNNLNS